MSLVDKEFNIPTEEGKLYPAKWYNPKTDKSIGDCAYDSETTLIEKGTGISPDYILGVAYNGEKVYFIKKADLKAFFDNHKNNYVYMANSPFDLFVAHKIGACEHPVRVAGFYNHIVDIFMSAKLLKTSLKGENYIPSLAKLAEAFLKIALDKKVKAKKIKEIDLKEEDDPNEEEEQEELLDIRTNYGQFLRDGVIHYEDMQIEHLTYAGLDAIITYDTAMAINEKGKEDLVNKIGIVKHYEDKEFGHYETKISNNGKMFFNPYTLYGQNLQNQAFQALEQISKNGMCVDKLHVADVRAELMEEMEEHYRVINSYGYYTGKGSAKKLNEILIDKLKLKLPLSEKSQKPKTSSDVLEEYRKEHEFVDSYITYKEIKKLLDFTALDCDFVHTRFNPLVATGRTSSYSPNMQNLPRDKRIRKMFCARKGHVLISVDYSQVELRTLAQITYNMFGFSKMKDLINAGVDLHAYFASVLLKCDIKDVTKEMRQKAKAYNFGKPGGLGSKSFIKYAKDSYNVIFTEAEVEEFDRVYFKTFPEMELYLKGFSSSESGFRTPTYVYQLLNSGLMDGYTEATGRNVDYSPYVFKGIISGGTQTSSGREYTPEEVEWAFGVLKDNDFYNKDKPLKMRKKDNGIVRFKYDKDIEEMVGSKELWKDFERMFNIVHYPTGMMRGQCTFTQGKNAPFQGLAAIGAKKAMVNLTLAGYRIVMFIHDEFIVEVPITENLREVSADIKRIMVEGMREFTPDVEITAEEEYMFSWNKSGTLIVDNAGKIIPTELLAKTFDFKDMDSFVKEIKKDWSEEKDSYTALVPKLRSFLNNDRINSLTKEYDRIKMVNGKVDFMEELLNVAPLAQVA